MRSVVFFALSALALFGAEILCLAPTAAAQTVEVLDEAEALAVDAKLYAEAYGVTQVEATRRLLIMHGTGEQVAQIEQEYGASLAGVYFDNGSQFDIRPFSVRVESRGIPFSAEV